MKKGLRFAFLTVVGLSVFSCGHKGPILAPFKKIPQPVQELSVRQVGEELLLQWKNPASYENGDPLSENREVEIWLLSAEKESEESRSIPGKEDFEDRAELLKILGIILGNKVEDSESPPDLPTEYTYKLPDERTFFVPDKVIGDTVSYQLKEPESLTSIFAFSVRVRDKKRESTFFEPVKFEPAAVSRPPLNLRAQVFEDRLALSWDAPKVNINSSSPAAFKGYNIYREDEGEKARRRNSTLLVKNAFDETSFHFGAVYRFFVRTSYSDTSSLYESADSQSLEVKPEDKFPPRIPAGITAIAGENLISLSWTPNTEHDLAGYSVWRKAENEADFSLITPVPILQSHFDDTHTEKGRAYFYAVTALDTAGNTSEKSKPVSLRTRRIPS